MTSRHPSAPKARTSPAIQSDIHRRPSCHRGDSPIRSPVAKVFVMRQPTPTDPYSHRSRANLDVTKTVRDDNWRRQSSEYGPMNAGTSRETNVMRPLRYSINVTLDGCCHH